MMKKEVERNPFISKVYNPLLSFYTILTKVRRIRPASTIISLKWLKSLRRKQAMKISH